MISNALGAVVESYVPGRIRVRLPRERRDTSVLSEVASILAGVDGIKSVKTNEITGSILVEYDADAINVEELIALGKTANLIDDFDLSGTGTSTKSEFPPTSATARSILAGFRAVDRMVHELSRGLLDAKTIMPLTLFGISLRNYLRSPQRSPVPWYTLLWYAYSTFMQWNRPGRTTTDRANSTSPG
ncbi:MAG: heavy-metal-associated domain-containing protein [Armatimonadetes bacterium]|nr:heavy-metal-associated domain-containing protein [Armatimonadota bacterium]